MYRSTLAALALVCGSPLFYVSTATAQEASASISIRNHKFVPATITVKAGVKITLSVTNSGTEPAEFESSDLNREKVIAPGTTATIYVGPLAPGSYSFFDDFDQANTGSIIAK